MTTFWFAAALLCLGAVAILILPLWRHQRLQGRWSASGVAAAILVAPIAAGVYSLVTTYDESAAVPAATRDLAIVRQLAERLQESPDDVEGWQLLGQSFLALGEYGRARQAFSEAWQRTSTPSTALKLGLGEALIWTDPTSIAAQGGDLIEEVLVAEPANQRALWWGGLVAAERGQPAAARSRWSTLLSFNPPPEVAILIQQQMARLPGSGEGAATVASTAAGPVLTLDVSVGADMPLDVLGPDSYVFIFARAPGGGPPIAGVRHPVEALPGTFTLSDSDAIIAGRSLAAFAELAVVARISVSGDPIEQPGDLYAEATYTSGNADPIVLSIDRIVGNDQE